MPSHSEGLGIWLSVWRFPVWSQCLRLAVQLMYDLLLAVSAFEDFFFFFTKWTSLWSSDTLRFRAVSPEPSLLAHTSSESRGTFRQKARSLAPLNGWACAVKICHDGMLEDTNSLDAAHMTFKFKFVWSQCLRLAVQLMYDLLLAVSAFFFFSQNGPVYEVPTH